MLEIQTERGGREIGERGENVIQNNIKQNIKKSFFFRFVFRGAYVFYIEKFMVYITLLAYS